MVVIFAVAIIVVAATMTRDLAAVAALDDRRRRCPLSAASNVADDVSSLLSNSITTSGSSSNGDVGGGDGCSSPKSSSAVSTTTSCCGGSSSSSSRSGSDDDDSVTVARLSTVVNDNCHTSIKTPQLPSLTKDVIDDNNGEKDSSGSSNSSDAGTATTSTKIGGRLTFYKDGKFIFQLAAHHQQNPHNNRYTSCRWIPVPTVLQQHKNSVKNVGEWPQHQQNKTIWPYLVTNTGSDSISPQPTQQFQSPAITRIGERKQQQNKHSTTPPPHAEPCTVTVTTPTAAKVVATTSNIIRRPPRKCSNTTATENSTNLQPQHWQPQPQLRLVSRRSQHHHQSFMMVATKAIKAQRRLMPKKRRRMPRASGGKEFSVREKQQPPLNLERTVRYLWCRRHTSELMLRRKMSLNSSSVDCFDSAPPASRHVAGNGDSTCPINMVGGSKRRSAFSPLSNSVVSTVVSTITTTTSSMSIAGKNITGNSSPNKKCRFGQQQQQQLLQPKRPATVDGGAKKSVSSPSPQLSTNDHSITAILSGSAAGAKRNGGVVAATTRANVDSCVITSTITTVTSTVVTPQKNLPSTSAPLSLLRTLLKSPGGAESGSPTIATSGNNGGGYRQPNTMIGSRKRSAVESLVVSPIQPPPPVIRPTVDNPGTSMMAFPTVESTTSPVNDTTVALSALHQLPTLHHPAAAAAAAAGYFNVLYYHQAAMAAAMAYQNHAQLPQPLSKPQLQPPLMSSQFTTIAGSSWQQQLNQRIHLPALGTSRPSKVTTATISSSPSTVVAPYSSPLMASTVNGGSLLAPATPSPPPLLLHTHPAHHHHLMLHHQQQYLPVPTVQSPMLSSSYQQHRPQSRGVKKRTQMTMGDNTVGSVAKVVKEESPPSTDCMPLNLSKDSVGENVNSGASTTAVR